MAFAQTPTSSSFHRRGAFVSRIFFSTSSGHFIHSPLTSLSPEFSLSAVGIPLATSSVLTLTICPDSLQRLYQIHPRE